MPLIEEFAAREILDSRGRPTVQATCALEGGVRASAAVPSGASTGTAEMVELRDGDPRRYGGLGCRKAVAMIDGPIRVALKGRRIDNQTELDHLLVSLDGTPNRSRFGVNAILAVSIAFARSMAKQRRISLWQHFADLVGRQPETLPQLTINLFSGGKHAGQQVAIQDVLIVPTAARTIDESLAISYDVYQKAAQLILERYGMRLLRADEGGMAPPCGTPEEMIETAIDAIRGAGFKPGKDVALAVDVAATHFHTSEGYRFRTETLSSEQMVARVRGWVDSYPIVSVEDGLAENDWHSWPKLRSSIEDRALVVGDDLLCTNPEQIRRAIAEKSCNALLLKVNQIGTLTEAAEAYLLARRAGWAVTVSVRSGETEDNWAADLAVAWGDQFKNGSITQSERLSKYNRLLEIERDTGLPVRNSELGNCVQA
jgi:enolase